MRSYLLNFGSPVNSRVDWLLTIDSVDFLESVHGFQVAVELGMWFWNEDSVSPRT